MWLALVLALAGTPPYAGFTGADLVTVCGKSEALCNAYMVGFMDGHAITAHRRTPLFCLPTDEVKVELVREKVRAYLAQSDHLNLPASGLVVSALIQAYPCGKEARK